ncbi:MAG: hypothetical protein JXQ27_10390 [Acidobacteria bacterium]|nr:hypothetical protein [Acidobacteriota bacterium]
MTAIGANANQMIGEMSRTFESIGLGQQQVKNVFQSFGGLGDDLVRFADRMVDHMNLGPDKIGAEVLHDVRGGKSESDVGFKWTDLERGYKELEGATGYKEQLGVKDYKEHLGTTGYKEQPGMAGYKELQADYKLLWDKSQPAGVQAEQMAFRADHIKTGGKDLSKPIPAADFKFTTPLQNVAGHHVYGLDGKGDTITGAGRAGSSGDLSPVSALATPLTSLAGATVSTPGRLAVQEPFPLAIAGTPRLALERMTETLQTGGTKLRTHLESIGGQQADSALRAALEKFDRMSGLIHDIGRLLADMNRNLLR